MCGSSPDKQRPSANEIALAEAADLKDQEFERSFLPLEIFEIEQYRDPFVEKVNKSILGGRANADVALAERDAMAALSHRAQASGVGLGSANNASGFDDILVDTAHGLGEARTHARQSARQIRDSEGMGIVRTGQDVNRTATSGLTAVARSENFRAGARLRARMTENTSRAEMLGDLAVTAIGGAYRKFQETRARNEENSERARKTGPFPPPRYGLG